jgi:hypothetical protein
LDPLVISSRDGRTVVAESFDEHIKISDATMKNTSRTFVAAATLPTIRDRPRRRVRGNRARAMDPNEAPRMKSGSWTETVYRVVIAADRLMTMDELRDAVGKARTLEKAWISGVQRLKDSGHVVSYKWRIGTPAARQRFLEEVAAGRTQDIPAVRHRSRWGAAICALLKHSARDLRAHEISLELRKDPELAHKLSRNRYQIYQTLRALVTAGRVNKQGKVYRLADT